MSISEQPSAGKVRTLSPRERQICEGIWAEACDKEICSGLGIAHGTLRTHVTRILFKLHVRSRAGIARQFERARLGIPADSHKDDMRKTRRGGKLSTKCKI